MNNEILVNKLAELEQKFSNRESLISNMQNEISNLKIVLEKHQHTDTDGTEKLRRGSEVLVESGAIGYIGNGGVAQISSETQDTLIVSSGRDKSQSAAGTPQKTPNTVIQIHNQETSGFISSYTGMAYQNNGKSVTSGNSTITDSFFNWGTNDLATYYINIYNSSGVYQFTRRIASNTSSTITITGTWPSSVSNCIYTVFMPVYFGEAAFPYRRIYTGEGDSEGIRFGYGITNAGENGLLYMDSAGSLYWRNKAGSSTLVSATAGGATGTFTTVDGKTVTVTSGIITSIV
jgi:hypothetical protein